MPGRVPVKLRSVGNVPLTRLFRRRRFLADWIFTRRFNLGRTQFAIRMRELQAVEDEIERRGYPLIARHSRRR